MEAFENDVAGDLLISLVPEHILAKHFGKKEGELLRRKGVYAYEYMSSFKKFEETSLPPQEAFYTVLEEQHISNEDYSHAMKVWETFKLHTLGDYHDLYVKSDVLLLADVFENFRNLCMKNYEMDCSHVMTSPGQAWQACLKMIKIQLELLTDPYMHLFIERGIRGGISMISHRWAEANNKYLPHYDPSKP
ncbi:hypothetical protein X975_01672, partial [Stegodyphus mimosarum]